jgi:DNA-binding response OmpR family regulator
MNPATNESRLVQVVEDDPDVGEIMEMILDAEGYGVLRAQDGREALDQLREAAPCLILLDLMMPGMNGWEFRSEQLRHDELARIPVVVMTGAGDDSAKVAELNAAAYIRKPVELDELLRVVANHCLKR